MYRVTVLPFVHGLLRRPEPLCQGRRRLRASLDRSPNLRRCRRLAVKMDQHARTPLRMSLRIDLAMKNAERRGSIQSFAALSGCDRFDPLVLFRNHPILHH